MGTTQTSLPDASTIWLAGLSAEDFLVPSVKTPIAEVASAVASIALDYESIDIDGEVSDATLSFEAKSVFSQVMDVWGDAQDEESDLADRKVAWPQFSALQFNPSNKPDTRIQDNLKAIHLLREIKATQRELTNEDRQTLLRYCGWGGLARVFSPDGSTPHSLAQYRDELATLTSEEEFTQMRASITTAYYTAPEIAAAMWGIVQHLGFKGGRVFEPSAGVGHFLAAMPTEIAKRSEITSVELDPVTAGMLETNFGPLGVQVHSCALEKAKVPAGFYDLVIGNPPYGDFKSLDTSTATYADWSIHNYFLGKAVDMVRPGGLICMITSRHTMDSTTDSHRKWIAAHADLVTAFRMPTMTFKGFAGTEAVTDILVFQRRNVPDYRAGGWVDLGNATEKMLKAGQDLYHASSYGLSARDRSINGYYVGHPDHVIGLLEWESGPHGETLNPVFDGSISEVAAILAERTQALPQGLYQERRKEDSQGMPVSTMQRYASATFVSPGSMVLRGNRICVSEGEELLDIDSLYSGTARMRIIGMIEVRTELVKIIEHQARSQDDVELQRLQGNLNRSYDAFVNQFGYLSTTANSRLMKSDPDWPIMLAAELWDDEEQRAVKADIFSKRTVGNRAPPERVDNVKDAMLVSLALYSKIVLKDLALRTGLPVAQVVKKLMEEGLAYRDPVLARWVPADEYLSGHIRDKIAAAKAAGPAYTRNIPALEAVLPKDLGPLDVEARLGAPWIPVEVIKQFATELVNDTQDQITVSYEASAASWSVKAGYSLEYCGDRTLQTTKWGTGKRCALVLLEGALNQTPPTITQTIDGKSVTDKKATINAREKWQAIKDHFRSWVYKDFQRSENLLRVYNDQFNQIVERGYDGSHLVLQGMSSVVTPYQHQLNAIWRIICGGNTLLAHCVGAGKTLVMTAASMELRRLGKAAKPLHVVQNSCLEQYVAEVVRLYPQAKVLMASKDDLHADKRRTFCARAAMGNWDMIVMTQATFERLPLAPDVQKAFLDAMLGETRLALGKAQDNGAKRSLKEVEKRMKNLEAKIERMMASDKKDGDSVWFNELGVDYLFLDEAHAYKRLERISKMPRMAGLPQGGSQRAFDVFMKTRVLMNMRGGEEEGVCFATATPISNTLAELHVFQQYLQPNTLKKLGLYEFDAWSAAFGESVTGIELAPDGGGYRMNTRYCRFVNTPELMGIFKGVADIRTKQMLNLPTPKIVGGKPQTMVAKPSEELLGIVEKLVDRADAIRSKGVKPEVDNMLQITNDGRKAALDVRMVDASLPFDPNGKLALAANNIFRIWEDGHEMKAAQLVFSDLGTPGGASFNIYAEMKRLMVLKGIPAAQIEFVQDHDSDTARAKLFKKVRDGAVRVLMGSTSKMGTGTNVQTRLKAIHQIDAPWVPASVEQRDGRGDRQGNLNEEIELWRYCTEKSFDAYSWNLLTVKANFIEQIMAGQNGVRTVEDISMTALTYAEIKALASGNPLVMEKATVDAEVQKLGLKRSQWEDELYQLARRERTLTERMAAIDRAMPEIEQDAKVAAQLGNQLTFKPATELARKAVDEVGDGAHGIGAAFRAVSRTLGSAGSKVFGDIGSFELEASKIYDEPRLYLIAPISREKYQVERPYISDLKGVGERAIATLHALAGVPDTLRSEYGRKAEELVNVRKMRGEDFEHEEKLKQLLQRQREIEASLDLDKDEEGTQEMSAETV